MGDVMFEEEQENGMRVAVDFLNADTSVRNALISNISHFGEASLSDMGVEISGMMQRRGFNIRPEHVSRALEETYHYGLQRYIGEYDNSSLSEKDIFNENVEIDGKSVETVERRKRIVDAQVNDLDCSDHHIPSPWTDFVNRGYSEIKKTIYKELGPSAVDTFEYYFNYDTREVLHGELTRGLTNAYNKTLDEMQYFHSAAMKLDSHVSEVTKSTNNVSALEAAFK